MLDLTGKGIARHYSKKVLLYLTKKTNYFFNQRVDEISKIVFLPDEPYFSKKCIFVSRCMNQLWYYGSVI